MTEVNAEQRRTKEMEDLFWSSVLTFSPVLFMHDDTWVCLNDALSLHHWWLPKHWIIIKSKQCCRRNNHSLVLNCVPVVLVLLLQVQYEAGLREAERTGVKHGSVCTQLLFKHSLSTLCRHECGWQQWGGWRTVQVVNKWRRVRYKMVNAVCGIPLFFQIPVFLLHKR